MRIRIIDAFTDRPFAGNPAAVCLLDADAWPDEAWMQQVASEMHLSETAFAHPLLDDEAAVRALAPDLGAIARIARRDGIRGIVATAPAAVPDAGYDFVSRFFAPADGIPEDPVTGSAHTALAPFWATRLGRDGLTGLQASARGGLVRTSIHGDRVHLSGHAVVVLDGTL